MRPRSRAPAAILRTEKRYVHCRGQNHLPALRHAIVRLCPFCSEPRGSHDRWGPRRAAPWSRVAPTTQRRGNASQFGRHASEAHDECARHAQLIKPTRPSPLTGPPRDRESSGASRCRFDSRSSAQASGARLVPTRGRGRGLSQKLLGFGPAILRRSGPPALPERQVCMRFASVVHTYCPRCHRLREVHTLGTSDPKPCSTTARR